MKIYTNKNHEIIGYEPNYIPIEYDHEYDVEDDLLSGKSFTVACGYKYEPQYELDFAEDGSLQYDERGNLKYKLNENGEKIFNGYGFFPFIDSRVLEKFQTADNESTKKVTELQLALTQIYEMMITSMTKEVK